MFFDTFQFFLLMSVALVTVYCASLAKDSDAQITDYDYINQGKGNYFFRYNTTNGIARFETGTLVNEGLPNEHIAVEGFYTFTNTEGKQETWFYKADENGFTTFQQPKFTAVTFVSDNLIASLLGK